MLFVFFSTALTPMHGHPSWCFCNHVFLVVWSTGKYTCKCPPRSKGCQTLAGNSCFLVLPCAVHLFKYFQDDIGFCVFHVSYQVHTLLKGLEKIAASADIPMLVCGDFSSIPGRSVDYF